MQHTAACCIAKLDAECDQPVGWSDNSRRPRLSRGCSEGMEQSATTDQDRLFVNNIPASNQDLFFRQSYGWFKCIISSIFFGLNWTWTCFLSLNLCKVSPQLFLWWCHHNLDICSSSSSSWLGFNGAFISCLKRHILYIVKYLKYIIKHSQWSAGDGHRSTVDRTRSHPQLPNVVNDRLTSITCLSYSTTVDVSGCFMPIVLHTKLDGCEINWSQFTADKTWLATL